MHFLGIDVGIRQRTSWALIDRAGEVVSLGDVAVDPEMGNDRYAELAKDLYGEVPWDDAEVVGVEWPWLGPNKYSAQTIAMATGVVVAVAALYGKEVVFVEAKRAKKALTGDHLASSKRMQLQVMQRYGRDVHGDQASAIGVGLAVWERRRGVAQKSD